MKKYGFLLLGLLGIAPASAQQRTPKVVFIIVDGIPADVLEKAPTPNIRQLITAGTYLRAHVGGEIGRAHV